MTEHANPQTGDPDELLGLDQASALLGVPVEQVKAMAEQGLITSIEDEGGTGFRRGELIAAREAGG
ncbi:MAG TPA: hypothetical protein VFU14_02290 [Acidimicrobiales bacterium]|nr:hypothetical protein [Acidimicrobiales bacterium]